MGILEDILSALDRIPLWKRLAKVPGEVDSLEARVKAIEEKLAGGSGKLCPICNSVRFRVVSSSPTGFFDEVADFYKCEECGHSENRNRMP